MPIYDYECPECGSIENVWARINETVIDCKNGCGKEMKRIISATRINPDWEPYVEYNLGHDPVVIKSRQHRKEEMKRRGLSDKWSGC